MCVVLVKSSSSNDTSFSCKNKFEGEVVGSKPIGCVCNLLIKKKKSNIYERERKRKRKKKNDGKDFWVTHFHVLEPCLIPLFVSRTHVEIMSTIPCVWPVPYWWFTIWKAFKLGRLNLQRLSLKSQDTSPSLKFLLLSLSCPYIVWTSFLANMVMAAFLIAFMLKGCK